MPYEMLTSEFMSRVKRAAGMLYTIGPVLVIAVGLAALGTLTLVADDLALAGWKLFLAASLRTLEP